MNALAYSPAFSDDLDGAFHSFIEQEPDDYVDKKVRSNVLHALDSEVQPQNVSVDTGGSYWNDPNAIAVKVSQTVDKVDVEQVLLPIDSRNLDQEKARLRRTLTPTAEWEGYIDNITGDEFLVKMVNVRSKSRLPADQATFSNDDVSEYDRQLLKEGAIVRWVIGRERLPTGQVRKVSELYFRRLPAHSEEDYRRAYGRANSLLESVVWQDDAEA